MVLSHPNRTMLISSIVSSTKGTFSTTSSSYHVTVGFESPLEGFGTWSEMFGDGTCTRAQSVTKREGVTGRDVIGSGRNSMEHVGNKGQGDRGVPKGHMTHSYAVERNLVPAPHSRGELGSTQKKHSSQEKK